MKQKYVLLVIAMNVLGCSQDPNIIMWDYGSQSEITSFTIMDTDSTFYPKSILQKKKLAKLEPYKYLIINSDSFYQNNLDLYKFKRKQIDTIFFQNRYADRKSPPGSAPPLPPAPYESISMLKYKEECNKTSINREINVSQLLDCLKPLKAKFDIKKVLLQMVVHKNGDILEYRLSPLIIKDLATSSDTTKINKLSLAGKDCFINLGELKTVPNARMSPDKVQMTLILK